MSISLAVPPADAVAALPQRLLWLARPETLKNFCITGPALISFSGGRTSGLMLWLYLQAHGGTLPPDVYVVFCNTGDEDEATLRFVWDCATNWNVPIIWIERDLEEPDGFRIVGLNSASRAGEPLTAVIHDRSFLPNGVSRFCTTETKVVAARQFSSPRGISIGST